MTEAQHQAEVFDKTTFGFWLYLMTDCVLFATLFAVYIVLRGNTFGGPSTHDLFDLPYVMIETLLLLTSSFTCGLATLSMQRRNASAAIGWLGATLVLGLAFLGMELTEFQHLIHDGNGPSRSGFLSSYFALVGTHGLHILIGSLWMIIFMIHIMRRGLDHNAVRKLTCLSMFWHFLDIVWIFIFTIVYLQGVS